MEEIKKKKDTLMCYYRSHLNKYKKSLKSGTGENDIYTTNWFAYKTMDSFLRVVYESNRTLNTVVYEDGETQERTEGENNLNQNTPHLFSEIEETSQCILGENRTPQKEYKHNSQNFSLQFSGRKRQLRDDLPPEIREARRQMDEAFQYMKDKKDDEYEMFGRFIATRVKTIKNQNTRDILMNDIYNSVFRTCMMDHLEQQSAVPAFSNRTNSVPSTSQSPQSTVYSSSPNPYTFQSFPGSSKSQSPHNEVNSLPPNPYIFQSPPGPSTSQSPHNEVNSPPPNPYIFQSPPGPSTSQSPHHEVYSPSPPNPYTYQSPPGTSTSQSLHHEVYSPSLPNPYTYQSPPGSSTSPSPHSQIYSPSPLG